ncbi:MAG: hypothetical protein HYY78_00060 [Betaproteobacteria bacterium]|nr:hypothetical protein [Betaproteobacteria bacterium]
MIRFLPAAAIAWAAFDAAAQTFVVPPELWDRPRSGRAVLEQPAIRQAVNAWLELPGARLVVRHGAGQESLLAAEELRFWLAALAVEPGRIALRGDLQSSEPLRIEVEKGDGRGTN